MYVGEEFEIGCYEDGPPPPPPYACASCRKVLDSCKIEDMVFHLKMSRPMQSGFYKSWTLKCRACGGYILKMKLIDEPQQMELL